MESKIKVPSIEEYLESVKLDLIKEKRIQKINSLNGIVDEDNIKKIKQYEKWIEGSGIYHI